jgi:mRNA interferase RelE/StbE
VPYRVAFTPRSEKEFGALTRQVQKRIARWLSLLGDDPRREGTKKLEGHGQLRRVHASKDYVIVYVVRERAILVLIVRVAHPKEVYRGL